MLKADLITEFRLYLLERISDRRRTADMLWQDKEANAGQYRIADELERALAKFDELCRTEQNKEKETN